MGLMDLPLANGAKLNTDVSAQLKIARPWIDEAGP